MTAEKMQINATLAERPYNNSAGDGVTSANAGKHFPKRVENAPHCRSHAVNVVIVNVRREDFAFDRRMCAIGFDVDTEVFVMFGIGETVMFLQPIDLRFADCGNLTLVSVKNRESLRGGSTATTRSERDNQVFCLQLFLCVPHIDLPNV